MPELFKSTPAAAGTRDKEIEELQDVQHLQERLAAREFDLKQLSRQLAGLERDNKRLAKERCCFFF